MTDTWNDLIRGERWLSPRTVWVEDDTEYTWEQVGELAAAVEKAIADAGAGQVVRVRSDSKLGCFAGQLGAWRAQRVAVADDGSLGPSELDRVRPDLTLAVSAGPHPRVRTDGRASWNLPDDRIPADVAAVNFTSGSTGQRKAVAVTRGNLLALFGCRDLDVPTRGTPTAGSFAKPAYDGWWFDTWRTVAACGTVVCLPHVNEDVFAWPELAERYRIDRVLLPAAVVATVVATVPECLAGIPWVFSGGEQFRAATCRQARDAGLTNRFVNLYGPTEATFATHKYELPPDVAAAEIPIGRPLEGCRQSLHEVDGHSDGTRHLVVAGPLVCPGYLDEGTLAHRFPTREGQSEYRTGDLVRVSGEGDLVFAGRLDGGIKVNGLRIDTAALEQRVAALPHVLDCRVGQDERSTVAFVRVAAGAGQDPGVRPLIEPVIREFSPAIGLGLVERFPVKPGGKVDFTALMAQHHSAPAPHPAHSGTDGTDGADPAETKGRGSKR